MMDFPESLEAAAEARMDEIENPLHKADYASIEKHVMNNLTHPKKSWMCPSCKKLYDPKDAQPSSPNPYCSPICPGCFSNLISPTKKSETKP